MIGSTGACLGARLSYSLPSLKRPRESLLSSLGRFEYNEAVASLLSILMSEDNIRVDSHHTISGLLATVCEISGSGLFAVYKELEMNELTNESQSDFDTDYHRETRRIEAHKLRLKIHGPKVCKFDQGKKNNIVAREYGPDIFKYIEPQGKRLCQSHKRPIGGEAWADDPSDRK